MNKAVFVPKLCSFPQYRTRLITFGVILMILSSACGNIPSANSSEQVRYRIQAAGTPAATPTSAAPTVTDEAAVPGQGISFVAPTATPVIAFPYITPADVAASPTPQPAYSSTYYGCYSSAFVKDITIPDGTVFSPGETFVKTWKFRNNGSCIWTSNFSIVFVQGDNMSGSNEEIAQTVYVNQKADISVELTAPDTEGTYYGYWRLADGYGNAFGVLVYVEITVAEATSTPTATPTATITPTPAASATASSTSTPTDTPTATNTLAPTLTSTALPSTSTLAPTLSSTPTVVYTATMTPVPTLSSVPMSMNIPVVGNTLVPTSVSTAIPNTLAPTLCSSITDTPIPTATPTDVPTVTPNS